MIVMYIYVDFTFSALEPWSVGIGGQGGDPAIYHQKFEHLERKLDIDLKAEQVKMIGCGVNF
jgi:hypothetical protein